MRPSRLRMWPPLPPDVYLRRPARVPPFPLAAPGCLLLRKARQALFFGVQGLDLRPGDEVLMPAYHHGSEVEALLRTDLTCRFYDVGPSLRPDARALDELIGPRTRALYLIHYLGFAPERSRLVAMVPGAGAAAGRGRGAGLARLGPGAAARLVRGHGRLLLLQGGRRPRGRGAAQQSTRERRGRRSGRWDRQGRAPAGQPPRGLADLEVVVGGQPAGPLHAQVGAVGPDLPPRQGPGRPVADRPLPPAAAAGARPGRAAVAQLPSPPGRARQAGPAGDGGAARRRLAVLPPDPDDRQAGADRAAGRARDRRRGLLGLAHPSLPATAFPLAAGLRASIVGVPVHQELRPRDLDRIVTVVRQWGGRARTRQPRAGAVRRRA